MKSSLQILSLFAPLLMIGCATSSTHNSTATASTTAPETPTPQAKAEQARDVSPTAQASAHQTNPVFEDLARHIDHSAIYMNQDQAFAYCAAKGSHLPSVREYAIWSATQGAAGIRETAYKDVVYTDPLVKAERELNGKSGFFVVYRQTADGKMVVDFYYNRNGYKRPAGEIGDTWFWTSSQFPADSGLAFVYDAPAGVVHYGFYHAKWYPVRCVAGRE